MRTQQIDRMRLVIVGSTPEFQSKLEARSPGIQIVGIDVGDDTLSAIVRARPGVILLSKAVGVRTALWLCRVLKEKEGFAKIPVIFYGYGDDSDTESAAFAAGADDYVPRFTKASALSGRIRAILRRFSSTESPQAMADEATVRIGDIEIRPHSYSAKVSGQIVPLTAGEFRVLWKLARNQERAFSAEELAPPSLDPNSAPPDKSVRSHICALRRKLGRRAGSQIQTIRNAGYRLTDLQP